MSRYSFTISCGSHQKEQVNNYFEQKGITQKSKFIVDLALKAIALNKTDTLDILAVGDNTALYVNCDRETKIVISNFTRENNLSKSRWLLGLIYEAIL